MKDLINEFTDHLRNQIILQREYYEHARHVNRDSVAMTRFDDRASYAWDVLYRYYQSVLKMKRYQIQRRYAAGILRELNAPLFDAIEEAHQQRRRHRPKPPGEDPSEMMLPG